LSLICWRFALICGRYHPIQKARPICNAWNADMEGATEPTVSPSQVLDGLRAAYAYFRAMEAIRGGLVRSERQALKWCLHAHGEWAAVWEEATSIERAEASDLIAEIAEYVEPTEDVADELARARRERSPRQTAKRRRLLPGKPA
jgi:hypothetical protein